MKTFLEMCRRVHGQIECGHARCLRTEFECHWYDYMYGLGGRARFRHGIPYDQVIDFRLQQIVHVNQMIHYGMS